MEGLLWLFDDDCDVGGDFEGLRMPQSLKVWTLSMQAAVMQTGFCSVVPEVKKGFFYELLFLCTASSYLESVPPPHGCHLHVLFSKKI